MTPLVDRAGSYELKITNTINLCETRSRVNVFENKIDTTSAYGFRYIVYQGDRAIVFQNSFDGVFTQPAVERMYNSVKPTE